VRALVAMSGGVDSSVAAALMLDQGHDVVGVTLKQWVGPNGRLPTSGCCTVEDAEDARAVANRLDIPHYVLDHVEDFTSSVVDRFVDDYLSGRTPNPCIECNRTVRFGTLLERVDDLDCDVLVTGHHARVENRDGWRLLAGRDAGKDQSYVLHMLTEGDLARVRLPVGELTKDDVRAIAADIGLRVAGKRDSQDLCFVQGDYRSFIRSRVPGADRPGEIVDLEHGAVGSHDGIAGFTIGQRKGLGVALGEPRFVLSVDAQSAVVTIGPRRHLEAKSCIVDGVSFVAGRPPADSTVEVKVRYRSRPRPATIEPIEGLRWRVGFDEPQTAVAPGQAAVFYRGEEVLGGGIIAGVGG
jgi:tRNA-specific 2-thiouridylase